jgi:hypothetical protein
VDRAGGETVGAAVLTRRLLLVLLCLASVEVGFRLLPRGPAAELAQVAAGIQGWEDPTEADSEEAGPPPKQTIHPYVGWANERWEERYAELATSFTEESFDVVVLGGSVAAKMFAAGAGEIEDMLEEDPRLEGRAVHTYSLSRGGLKQPQQLILLSYLLDMGWKPDAVIEHDGFNELALAVQNALEFGVHPLHPVFPSWGPLIEATRRDPELDALGYEVRLEQSRARELADSVARLGIDYSGIASRFALEKMRSIQVRFNAARGEYLEQVRRGGREREIAGPPFEASFENALELAVRNWTESSRSMHAICSARGIVYVHVLHPTLHDVGSKPLTQGEIEAGAAPVHWVRAIEAGYPRLRQEGARLAEEGVAFHDSSLIFADDQAARYVDACHVNGASSELLARDVARALLEALP